MKISVLKENLKKALDVTSRITSKSFSFPILNNVLLSIEKNFLQISATNLEIGIRYWVLAKTEKAGKITVPAKLLNSLVSSLGEAKISLEEKENTLYLWSDNFKTQIKGASADDFPIIPEINTKDFIVINAHPFCQGLSQMVDNVATTQTRPEITGVHLCFKKERVIMAATDSFRLAERKLSYRPNISKSPDFTEKKIILPSQAARELISTIFEKNKKIKICFSVNQILFEIQDEELSRTQFQIITRLIEGDYPAYQEIIPKKSETRIVLSKEEFLQHLKVASLFSSRINEVNIDINPSKNEMCIISQSQELGGNHSRLNCKIEGEKVEVSFNWRFLMDGLNSIKSAEVVFELSGEDGPAALKPVGDQNFIYIVMPVKAS